MTGKVKQKLGTYLNELCSSYNSVVPSIEFYPQINIGRKRGSV